MRRYLSILALISVLVMAQDGEEIEVEVDLSGGDYPIYDQEES